VSALDVVSTKHHCYHHVELAAYIWLWCITSPLNVVFIAPA